MSRRLKISLVAFSILIILVLSVWGLWFWFTHQALPKTSGTLKVSGLDQRVEIVRDEYGIAHIYAHTPEDLYFAEGYVHAQERFWQMEFQRRTAKGRLSEIFGEQTLGTDRYLRYFGFQESVEQSYAELDGESRRVVDAYTAGVNAYISKRRPGQLGLEFALLGLQGIRVEIEPWTGPDSLIWGEMMIFDQSDQLRSELKNIALLAAVGQERYRDMRPAYRDDRPVIIASEDLDYIRSPRSAVPAQLGGAELDYLANFAGSLSGESLAPPELAQLGLLGQGASNSFAVSGERSATGMPLLANDPHMGVNMPALWYEIGMHCVEVSEDCRYNFRGFSLPGIPGVLIGHNDHIAWALTNASFDAEDVFIERLNPENPNQYEVNGEWVDMEIRREEIQVRGREAPEVLFVRSTRNGLVASDGMVSEQPFSYADGEPELFALSYAWTALEPVQSMRAVMMVNRAQNWDEFVEALQYFDAGKQNWLYADVEGNIGYIMPGKVPMRAGGDGSLPVPGWNDDFIWTGFIPYENAPRVFNPEKGYIVTANNPQVRAEDYPYLISTSQDRGQRAERITELLAANEAVTVEDMIAIQTDNQSLSALEIIPYLEGLRFDDPAVAAARDRLLDWDAQMQMDSPEAALFNIFWVHLLADTYHDQLPERQFPNGDHMTADSMDNLLAEPNAGWWDDATTPGQTEDRDDILLRAFTSAYAEGVETLGNKLDNWRWGEMHTITFRNATLGRSGIALIENIFNRGPYPTNGSESVVQKTCWNANAPYQVTCIPALRRVIDLGDLSNSLTIHSVGQSGHPVSPHYDDFIDPWRTFQYHPSNWERAQAEAGAHDTLILTP